MPFVISIYNVAKQLIDALECIIKLPLQYDGVFFSTFLRFFFFSRVSLLRVKHSILSSVRIQKCIKVVFFVVMNKIWMLLILGISSDDEEPVKPINLGQCPVPCPVVSAVPVLKICTSLMISSLVWELLLAD